jgi:SAM-dependent methyltransferase
MNLLDIINRTEIPAPWSEGEKIPWDDPAFSERMLREHLSQEHDAASRRFEKIDAHVDWIHHELLSGRVTRILDLGCGPGLYASRLARLGHACVGIDFSPASIAYAAQTAEREGLRCVYRLEDIRTAVYGQGFGLVMDGILLLEVSTFESLKEAGEREASWYSSPGGLFSDRPHLCLTESFWDAGECVVTTRHFVVDAAAGDVARCAESLQAYSDELYCSLLTECGFARVRFYPSLVGTVDETQNHFFVIVARK